MIYLTKVRRVCGVKGCGNKDCYAVSRSSEPGYSVIICPECLKTAYEEIAPKKKTVKKGSETK